MTASRLCRILVLVLATGVVVFAGRPARLPAAPRGDDRTVPVLFDSILVAPSRFSPNGDFVQDSVAVTYTLPETSDVFVYVTPAGSPSVIFVVQQDSVVAPVMQRRAWDGFDTEGFRQPEGSYTVHFTATTVSQRVLSNQRQVRLDLTTPAPSVLEVAPRRFALPRDAGLTPSVRLRVSRSDLDDQIAVTVLDPNDVPRAVLLPEGGFAGDGDYVFLCRGLADPDSAYADGVYRLHVVGQDLAGNDSTVVDSLDKNTLGPKIAVSHPPTPRAVQRADSLVGQATDRQSVAVVEADVFIGPDTTTTFLPPRDGAPGPTYRYWHDLSTLLAAEGTYPIRLRATDEDGIADTLLVHLRVDRTPPPAPIPIPPLPEVTKSQVLTVTVQVDTTDTSRIVFTGGAQPPDSLFAVNPLVRFTRTLAAGANRIGVKAVDRAGNISAEHVSTVVWDTDTGITAPERFVAGQSIEVNLAGRTAQSVSVRILAMDGGLVRTFHDGSAKQYYRFPWDLRTPDGREVRNGAYLVLAHVLYTDGTERRLRTMIAVVQ